MPADLLELMGIKDQVEMTKEQAPLASASSAEPCLKRQSCREFNRRLARRPQPPQERVRAMFRRQCEGRSQRQIAAEFGIKQSSVCQGIKRCKRYIAETGASLEVANPSGELHLANVTEAMELEALQREAEELTRIAQQPYQGRVITVEIENQPKQTRTVTCQDPPRVGWINARERIIGKKWAARRRLDAEAKASCDSTTPAHPHTPAPPASALSPSLVRAEAYDDFTHNRWDAIDRSKRSCGKRCANDHVVSLPEREAYWRYQALGLTEGLGREVRQKLVLQLQVLDEMAVKAAAMVEANDCGLQIADCGIQVPSPQSTVPSHGDGVTGDSGLGSRDRSSTRHFLELLLILDLNYSREQTARILRHFDEASGRFDWQVPAEDLRWLIEDEEVESPESAVPSQESASGATGDCGLETRDIPFFTGPPAVITPARRQWFIDSPFDKRVCFIRLDGSIGSGLYLHDVPNDQSSVVIWELVEEVIKGEVQSPLSTVPSQDGKSTVDSGLGTGDLLLTDELRQELFRKVGTEGVAVLTHDGHIYTGEDLGRCGLVQRGIIFLRELCHSTPPWGESIWRTFEPKPRKR